MKLIDFIYWIVGLVLIQLLLHLTELQEICFVIGISGLAGGLVYLANWIFIHLNFLKNFLSS